MKPCDLMILGLTSYPAATEMQDNLVGKIAAGQTNEKLILLEHPHVITMGRGFHAENLLFTKDWLHQHGIAVEESGRGGDVTYHGPGQIVGYPLIDLSGKPDLHLYLRNLEELMIRALGDFGISAGRKAGMTGAWIGDDKVGAIGVRVSRWITSHGFALNVNSDLKYFEYIVPCGIRQHGVTSMQKLLGREVPIEDVQESLVSHFEQLFDRKMIRSVTLAGS